MRLLYVFGTRACASEVVSTVGVGCPGFLVVTGILLIVCGRIDQNPEISNPAKTVTIAKITQIPTHFWNRESIGTACR
jgi:hypothetical protein